MIRCIDVALIIPDNEARTALATLQRLGVGVAMIERADLYRFDVEDEEANDLVTRVRATETLFNPNKHIMRVRALSTPDGGEVWVGDLASPSLSVDVRVGGRVLAGVRAFERFTAWRIYGAPGVRAHPDLVAAATETLLCNPAFQKASVA